MTDGVDLVSEGSQWVWWRGPMTAPPATVEERKENLQDAPLFTGGLNNVYLLVRAEFDWRGDERVRLRCSANDLYEVTVNGAWVGRGPAPSDPSYAYVDAYDVTDHLREGRNALAFLAFNQGEGSGHPQFQTLYGPGGLLFELRSGSGEVLARSTTETRLLRAPHIQQGTDALRSTVWGYEEVWSQAQEPAGWRKPGFDDSAWERAVASRYAPARLIRRSLPPLVRWDAAPLRIVSAAGHDGAIADPEALLRGGAVTVRAGEPGSLPALTIDFGREVVGFPLLDVEGTGGYVMVSYGETQQVDRCDTIVPDGRMRWSPYHRRAFRFMRLEFAQFELCRLHAVGMRCVNAPLETLGAIDTGDDLLQRIWELGRYTLQTATQDYYEADAWRERAIWYCGTEHRIAAATFGVDGVLRETLRQVARIQRPEGFLPASGPVGTSTILPEVQTYWVTGLLEGTLLGGDVDFARELFGVAERVVGWFDAQRGESGLLDVTGKPWWVWIDWGRLDRRGEVAILNFRFHEVARNAAALARLVGRDDRALAWTRLADDLRERCRDRFRDPDRGVYADCWVDGARGTWTSQQTNAIAVLTGVATPQEGRQILKAVTDPALLPRAPKPFMALNDVAGGWYQTVVDQTGYGEPQRESFGARVGYAQTGFGAHWLAEALFRCGLAAEALEYIRFYWGRMLERGATTAWEFFDPYTQRSAVPELQTLGARWRQSRCHVYAAGATYLLSRYLLGVWPLAPGYAEFALDPCAGDLKAVSGRVPSPRGPIEVAWRRHDDGDGLAVSLVVPEGTHARYRDAAGQPATIGPGSHSVELVDAGAGPAAVLQPTS